MVDQILKRDSFAILSTIKDPDISSFNTNTWAQQRAAKIIADLQALHPTTRDIFTYDNTSTIESFFNVVKGRTPKDSPRLIDTYSADADADRKRLVSCRMVRRQLGEDPGGDAVTFPMGATQGTATALGYSQSWTMSGGSTGELYLSKLEKKLLGVGSKLGAHSPLEDLC